MIHSFWVPDFRMKQDVFPNRFTTYWFQTEKLKDTDNDNPDLGYRNKEHWVFCAEYCGDNHSEMAAIIRVVPQEHFAAWVREPFKAEEPLVNVGKILYSNKGCVQMPLDRWVHDHGADLERYVWERSEVQQRSGVDDRRERDPRGCV